MRLDSKFLKTRLGRRMLAVFVACAMLPVTALATVTLFTTRQALQEQSLDRLKEATKTLGMSLLERLLFGESELHIVALEVQAGRSPEPLHEVPERFNGIAVVRAGHVIDASGQSFTIGDRDDAVLEQLETGRPALSFVQQQDGGEPALVMWIKVDGAADTTAADTAAADTAAADTAAADTLLAGWVNPEYAWGDGLLAGLPPNTELLLLTPGGRLLLSTLGNDEASVLASVGTSTDTENFTVELGGLDFVASRWPVPLRYAFGNPGIVAITMEQTATAFAAASGFGRTYALICLTAIWVVLLLSIAQIRRNLIPLDELRAGTERLAQRDFKARVEVSSNDELGDLAASFNTMAGRLDSQFQHLATLSEIDTAILSSLQIDSVLETSIELVARSYPGVKVGVGIASEDPTTMAVYLAGSRRAERVDLGDHEVAELSAESPWLELDVSSRGAGITRPLRRLGVEHCVAFPIRLDGLLAGVLLVAAGERVSLNDDDLSQLRQIGDQIGVALTHAKLIDQFDDMKQGALTALARAVDAKSQWTTGHSERVTRLSVRIGRQMGVSDQRLDVLNRGGLLHDIGKIGIPNAILDKPARLSEEEFEIMKSHPAIGARILEPITAYADVIPVVLQHHERVDGAGYPLGVGGDDLDPDARIMAVADVYDACSSDRPYREGMSLEKVLGIIRAGSGSHFDPLCVEALESVVAEDVEFLQRLRAA